MWILRAIPFSYVLQQEQEEEQISLQPLQYYDNKPTLDELMNKPDGLLYIIDEANKNNQGADFIIGKHLMEIQIKSYVKIHVT